MAIVWSILKFLILAYLLNAALKLSYNVIFFVLRKPSLWILFVTILGFGVVGIWGILGWSHSVVAWACLATLLLGIPPKSRDPDVNTVVRAAADDIYESIGISGGRWKYRLGLVGFAFGAAIAYMLFYGQVCSTDGSCVSIIKSLA